MELRELKPRGFRCGTEAVLNLGVFVDELRRFGRSEGVALLCGTDVLNWGGPYKSINLVNIVYWRYYIISFIIFLGLFRLFRLSSSKPGLGDGWACRLCFLLEALLVSVLWCSIISQTVRLLTVMTVRKVQLFIRTRIKKESF